jgi:hypothetical protein
MLHASWRTGCAMRGVGGPLGHQVKRDLEYYDAHNTLVASARAIGRVQCPTHRHRLIRDGKRAADAEGNDGDYPPLGWGRDSQPGSLAGIRT